MKREGLSFAARLNAWFAAVVILLSVALFVIAYLLLYRAVRERDREVVRAQLEIYCTWYAEGGLPVLSTRFLQQEGSGKETFFVRVLGAEGAALFASIPKERGKLDIDQLKDLPPNEAFALVWRTLPASDQSKGWLIATERLPDGSLLQVGKTTEALTALLAHFAPFSVGSCCLPCSSASPAARGSCGARWRRFASSSARSKTSS